MRIRLFKLGLRIALPIILVLSAHQPTFAADNAIVKWNNAALQAVRVTRLGPPMVARAFAILHTSTFDAWAAYDSVAVGTRLGGSLRRPASERTVENKQKAISFAAYRSLVRSVPYTKRTL